MKKSEEIKNLLAIVESKHPEISFYRNAKELKEFYIEDEFDNDIEVLRDFGTNDIFFNEDGSFPEASLYILYTTCSSDDQIYTRVSEFIRDHRKMLDSQDETALKLVDKLINDYDLDEDEQEDLREFKGGLNENKN